MAYVQTLIDNFGDASLDSSKWTITQGPGATESGGTLNLACVADYPRVEGSNLFDLSIGILAAKLSVSGTRSENTEFYIGARDTSGNSISALGSGVGPYITFQGGGGATFNTEVVTDISVGTGGSWVPGTWWGIGNLGSDNIIRMYNSINGLVWNEMAHCTIGGTFNKTSVGLIFMAGVWDGSISSLVANFDDASYFVNESSTFVTRKVMWNGSWIPATPKARVAGQWVPAAPNPRIAGAWDNLSI